MSDAANANDPTLPSAEADRGASLRGKSIGRYVVLDLVGSGGMGMVYAAYDPELDRKVAIKLVHSAAGTSRERQLRLLREAQALARLSHPNVVAVHDAGAHDDDLFLAMDFVEGQTLSAWLAAAPRHPREIVQAFLAAGAGLAAAHAGGIVHRDFKSDNVVVRSHDGQVLVVDFGLARLAGAAGNPDSVEGASPAAPPLTSSLRKPLTRVGALMGTPAYMAPEQHRGQAADAASDQFAFCVSLYEALYGELPFRAEDPGDLDAVDALALEVLAGKVRPPPPRSRVPTWMRRVILRGLKPEARDRWPSMDALLAALGRDPGRTARAWLGIALVAATIAAGAFALVNGRAHAGAACAQAAADLAPVWNPARKAQIEQAFAKVPRAYAKDTLARVEDALDGYAAAWSAMRTEACTATAIRRQQSPQLLDLRMACLDRRLEAFRALVSLLGDKLDEHVAARATQAVSELPGLDACADAAALRAEIPPPEDRAERQRFDQIEAELATVHALDVSGKYKEAMALVGPLVERAHALGHPVAVADTLFARAHLYEQLRDMDHAEPAMNEAVEAAAAAHEDARVAVIVSDLQDVIGAVKARLPEAFALEPIAHAALARAGGPPLDRIVHLQNWSHVLIEAGRYREAEAALREAIAIETTSGRHDLEMATVYMALAQALTDQSRYGEADVELDRGVDILRTRLGPDHPRMFQALLLRGSLGYWRHDLDGALAGYRAALAVAERAYGADSDEVARAMNNTGDVLMQRGQVDEAEDLLRRSQQLHIAHRGPDHPNVATTYSDLALIALQRGKPAEAMELAQKGLPALEKAFGRDNVRLLQVLYVAGLALSANGHAADAHEMFARTLALQQKSEPEAEGAIAEIHVRMAETLVALGRIGEAQPMVTDALAVVDRKEREPKRGYARFVLAQVLWASGDHGGATAKAREAKALYDGAAASFDGYDRADLPRLVAWLAAHGG